MEKTNILIAGIGGVGGYFGGVLAKHYEGNENVNIHFLARGKHLQEIKTNGLTVIQGDDNFTARPQTASDDAAEIGPVDFIILCTKSYDLETMIAQLKPCLHSNTILLPLLNGVDSSETIRELLPEHTVAEGCAYIVSRLKAPGKIENTGKSQKVAFGMPDGENARLEPLADICREAGIDTNLSEDILSVIWDKFIFISALASTTSYFDVHVGPLLEDPEKVSTLTNLISEASRLAKAKNIAVADDITEKILKNIRSLPYETTTSMHSDFLRKNDHTEYKSLTGYIVREGQKYNVETPLLTRLFKALEEKTKQLEKRSNHE